MKPDGTVAFCTAGHRAAVLHETSELRKQCVRAWYASKSMLQPGMVEETGLHYERAFLKDVLRLSEGESEEQMDEKLQNEAKELGIDIDALLINPPKPQSTRTFSSEAPRRSESIDSRASQSTGLTSNFSELSRDPQYGKGRQLSRVSLSFRDYDNFMARGRPNGRNSMSFSPPTTPARSSFSLPLSSPSSSPKRHFRRIRGLSMLRLNRAGSSSSDMDTCPHCPQDIVSQRSAVHKLPCGHRLCTEALRDTIRAGTATTTGAVPSCCGVAIPGTAVEHVMSEDEQTELLDKLEQWDEAASMTYSIASDSRHLAQARISGVISRTTSMESKVDSVAPRLRKDAEALQERPDFKRLHEEQTELLERFLAWMEKQRVELKARHDQLRKEMRMKHDATTEDLHEHHGSSMAEAEDKQVKAEGDMRETHAQEKRDNATALKHMQAYCAGTYSTGEPHNRTVTEQDCAELEKTRRIRDAMDAKHSSAINVLRGEQGRRMKLRAQRQEREVQELRRAQRKEELELERACTNDLHRFDESVAEKRKKMRVRWEIQGAILAKRGPTDIDTALGTTFGPVNWERQERNALTGAPRPHDTVTESTSVPIGTSVVGKA